MKAIFLTAAITVVLAGIIVINSDNKDVENTEINHVTHIAHQDTVPTDYPVQKTEAEWKEILTPSQFRILRNKGTELPYVNEYYKVTKDGVYVCAACGHPLYDSKHKYKSGTGWPSFWKPIADSVVVELEDNSLFMERTEIVCSNCGSHIGHVFDDGPKPTGLRYCMNSAAMKLVERNQVSTNSDN